MIKFLDVLRSSKPTPTMKFKELYDIKIGIEQTTLGVMAEMDSMTQQKKHLENQVAALRTAKNSAAAFKDFSKELEHWVIEKTTRHNTLCGYPGCYSNCHLGCNLTLNLDPDNKNHFKHCFCMKGNDVCSVCNHSYTYHYHNHGKWVQEKRTSIDQAMQSRFNAAQGEAQKLEVLKSDAQRQLDQCKQKQEQLNKKLYDTIRSFEKQSNTRNYVGMLNSQIKLLKAWIQAKDGLHEAKEMVENMRQTLQNLENTLLVVKGVQASKTR